jgi:hypothetical protein
MVVPNQHDRLPRILKTSKCSHFSLTTPHLASNSYNYVDVFANFLIVHVPSCVLMLNSMRVLRISLGVLGTTTGFTTIRLIYLSVFNPHSLKHY